MKIIPSFVIFSHIEFNDLFFLIKKYSNLYGCRLLVNNKPKLPSKNLLKSKYINKIIKNKINLHFFNDFEELNKILISNNNNPIISTHPIEHFIENYSPKIFNVLFQSAADTLALTKFQSFNNINLIFLHTEYWRKTASQIYKIEIPKYIKKKIFFYGYKKLLNETKNSKQIKKKLNIKNKKILLFLEPNLDKNLGTYNYIFFSSSYLEMCIKFIWIKLQKKKITKEINFIMKNKINFKKFCEYLNIYKKRNNFFLITKFREKFKAPKYLRKISNLVLTDSEIFPQKSLSLSKIADTTISFFSTNILESVFFNSKPITIKIPSNDVVQKKPIFKRTHYVLRYKNHKSIFNFRKINKILTPYEFINQVKDKKLNNLKLKNKDRKDYIKAFISDSKELNTNMIANKINSSFIKFKKKIN